MDRAKLRHNYDKENVGHGRNSSDWKGFKNTDQKIEQLKSELLKCRKERESTEMEMHNVCQLKDKGLFVLNNIESKYDDLHEKLNVIRSNFEKCEKTVNSYDDNVLEKIKDLTAKRNNLRKELQELKKTTDDNSKKFQRLKKLIPAQEKKNEALLCKLTKRMGRKNIKQDLKERINAILTDSRITKSNISQQNIV